MQCHQGRTLYCWIQPFLCNLWYLWHLVKAFIWMHIYPLRRHSLFLCFGIPGILTGGFSFGQESTAPSFASPPIGRGRGSSESQGGGARLPLVRMTIVSAMSLCRWIPLLPWIRILSFTSRGELGGCIGTCASFSGVLQSHVCVYFGGRRVENHR